MRGVPLTTCYVLGATCNLQPATWNALRAGGWTACAYAAFQYARQLHRRRAQRRTTPSPTSRSHGPRQPPRARQVVASWPRDLLCSRGDRSYGDQERPRGVEFPGRPGAGAATCRFLEAPGIADRQRMEQHGRQRGPRRRDTDGRGEGHDRRARATPGRRPSCRNASGIAYKTDSISAITTSPAAVGRWRHGGELHGGGRLLTASG
jgi:hypothetical protein